MLEWVPLGGWGWGLENGDKRGNYYSLRGGLHGPVVITTKQEEGITQPSVLKLQQRKDKDQRD
jgi:hypothetical protein